MSSRLNKLLLVLLAGLAFGSSIVMARFALREISPYPLAVFRFGIASLFYVGTFLMLRKSIPRDKNKLFDIALVGIVSTGLPLLTFLLALTFISSGVFSLLIALMPLVTAVFAHLFLKDEKFNQKLLLGLILAFAGVALLLGTKTTGLVDTSFDIKGPLIALVGVLLTAAGSIYARTKLRKDDVLVISGLQTIAAFVVLTLIVFSLNKFSVGIISPLGWFSIFYNAIVGSYIAFWLTFLLINKYGPTAASLPGYVVPVVSTTLGALLLGEIITLPLLLGILVIFAGIFFATK